MIIQGDCLEKLRELESNSVDAVVTDPPYGLSFMGKKWDYDVPSMAIWTAVFRVLKPGGHLLSFGGTRTYHRMVVAIEDAGFEIRDQIQWLYGSGFPKSHNISKAIDKAAGAEREVVGTLMAHNIKGRALMNSRTEIKHSEAIDITAPATPDAIKWDGWGSALKPANEPIVLARKPLEKGLTIAQNVLKWGTGALNIDGSRIGFASAKDLKSATFGSQPKITSKGVGSQGGTFQGYNQGTNATNVEANPQGRWPSNVILGCDCEGAIHGQMCAVHLLDEMSGHLKSGGFKEGQIVQPRDAKSKGAEAQRIKSASEPSSGGASRFFYCAKSSKSERNRGLENEVKQKQGARPNSADDTGKFPDHDHRPSGGNNHPTVKPVALMRYLIKLITPPGGIVLDPFTGSGTTGVACKNLGVDFIGIEQNPDYCEIARKRIEA